MSLLRITLIIIVTAVFSGVISGGLVWSFVADKSIFRVPVSSHPVSDFALLDHAGRFHQLYKYQDKKAVILYAYSIDCPSVEDNLAKLIELKHSYAKQGVDFFLIGIDSPNHPQYLQGEIAQFDHDIPILYDKNRLVVEELGIERAGEVIVLDAKTWKIHYRGPIEAPWNIQLAFWKVTRHYLKNAIDAVLDSEPVEIPGILTLGCPITVPIKPYHQSISYADDIVPILQAKCVSCHRAGGIAPWSMDNYETIKAWSSRMQEVIMTKQMPPWHADPTIGTFVQDRSLTSEQTQTLIHWIKAGAANGDQQDPLTENPPAPVDEWELGKPDLVIDIAEQKLPPNGLISYRWIKIPFPLEKDMWVRAVQLKPSNVAVMHHGFVFVDYPTQLKQDEPSWLEGRNGFFVAHVPGVNVLPLPQDSGQLLPAGSTLIFQLHYITAGYPTSDKPKLALYFHDQPPPMEYKVVSASNTKIKIPPFIDDHQENAKAIMEEDGYLHGFYPHMHYRGKWFRYKAIYPDGRSERLLSVPRYDLHWQTFYRLQQPKMLPLGTKIVVNAGFDNSEKNPLNPDPSKEVRWGPKGQDEMLVGYYMYTRQRK